ncbi:MAG: TonB-dependent receptor, partial [Saprospiraceae bacterium]
QDSDKNELIGAVVVALNALDSTMLGYAVTETDGLFLVSDLSKGAINLQITYIGYGTLQRKVVVEGDTKSIDLGEIMMLQEGKMLDAVTISADYVPIKVTKDTLEFNADAFKTQPNAVVEDLLKRLPGVEIDASGGIKIQGEDVKAVTVDGKEFFGKDPKMATRNLPANAVKKVQVFDKKSKTAEFTGIDDGLDEKTINLELKEDKRNGYFGNVMGGLGTDQRYETKAMINRFSPKTQLSFIGSLNNLNNSGLNVSDYMTMTGGGTGGGRNFNFNSGVPISFGQNNTGETSSATTGININHDLGNKNRISFSYYLTQSETDLRQKSLINSFLPSGALLYDKNYNSLSDGINHNFNSTIDIRIDSTTEMTVIGALGLRNSNNISNAIDTTFNEARTLLNLNDQNKDNNSDGNNYSLSTNIRKKLKKRGRTITLDGAIGNNNSDNFYRILSEVYGRDLKLNPNVSVFQDQNQFSDNSNYSFGGNYTEPLSSNVFLVINASRRNNRTDLVKDFLDLTPDNLLLPGVLNNELSRTFDNNFVYNTAGTNIRISKDTYSASLGVDFQNSNLSGIPSIGEKIDRQFNYFLPKASFELDKLRIRANYSTAIREPSMDQLQPVLDNSDPLNVYKGNPNLVPEFRHNMRLSYNFFDQFNFRSLFANVRMGYTKNRITT